MNAQQPSKSGKVLWPHSEAGPWTEGPRAICSRPIFDSPEPNSGASNGDTLPPSSHPIRRPAEPTGTQQCLADGNLGPRFPPGSCLLGPQRGWLRPLLCSALLPRCERRQDERIRADAPPQHLPAHAHATRTCKCTCRQTPGPNAPARSVPDENSSASMQRGSQGLGRTPADKTWRSAQNQDNYCAS